MAANSFIRFTISYQLTASGTVDSLEFVVNKAAIGGQAAASVLILSATLPQNSTSASRLFVSLLLDGQAMLPEIPAGGFANLNELYGWLQANWYMYGKWFITADKLLLYLNAGLATTGTLSINATAKYVYTALIPDREPEAYYYVTLHKDGADILPAFPEDTAVTVEDILVWANRNWSGTGQWNIEGNSLVLTTDALENIELLVTAIVPGGFDFGFSDGFDT